MKKREKIIYFILSIAIITLIISILVFLFTINLTKPDIKNNLNNKPIHTTITEILNNPNKFENKKVIVNANYGSIDIMNSCDKSKITQKTSSDMIIYDKKGSCIYLSNNAKIIEQNEEINKKTDEIIQINLKIEATLKLIDNKPILD